MGQPILRQLVTHATQQGCICGEPQSQRFISLRIFGYQVWQSDGVQQAGGHPPCERVALTRQDWQSSPERIARRRVGVVGQGIQKQIGEAMPRQMLLKRHPVGEHQPDRVYPSCGGFSAKIALRQGIIAQQPQHAALDRTQQSHPDVKHRRIDFEVVIEAAEHKAQLWQTGFGSGWCLFRDRAFRIIDLIALG